MVNTRVAHGVAIPRHVAIIMDGNGRWATRRGLPRLAGHKRGVERVREVVKACPDLGITHLTLFAFSTENWKRSSEEVGGLMRLFRWYIKKESLKLIEAGVRVRFIGQRHRFDADLQGLMNWLETETAAKASLNLTIALDYGGRNEITRAVARIAEKIAAGQIQPQEISDDLISAHLDTAGMPDPDLVLRTSGEVRISNYLLWQAAYAEYNFPDICWPDFTAAHLADALDNFGQRERRFGALTG